MKKIENFRKFIIPQENTKKIRGGFGFSPEAVCNMLSGGLNLAMQNRDTSAMTAFSLTMIDAGCI
jgi:hypothetical protein